GRCKLRAGGAGVRDPAPREAGGALRARDPGQRPTGDGEGPVRRCAHGAHRDGDERARGSAGRRLARPYRLRQAADAQGGESRGDARAVQRAGGEAAAEVSGRSRGADGRAPRVSLELFQLAIEIALADAEDARGLLAMAAALVEHPADVTALDLLEGAEVA